MLLSFPDRKPNTQKLLSFGFVKQQDCYTYCTDLPNYRMRLTVFVSKNGEISTKVTDESGEEYILHLVKNASGSFVGQVRAEYEEKLNEIAAQCFDLEIFRNRQTKEAIAYIKDRYGDELEYLWKKTPNNAIVRRKDNKKWYAAFLTVSRRRLGFDSDEMIEILDLRMKPEEIGKRVDHKNYFPGYHMNKKHWITICFDETLSLSEICKRIDESYRLALK